MSDLLDFYRTQSPITDPGEFACMYDDLPDDLKQLFRVINNVLSHAADARERYGPTSVQRREQYLRTMRQRLGRLRELDPSPLTTPREMKEKQISLCRDYAVFMTSILRHKGHPARTRAGHGCTFVMNPPYRGDHWVTEVWDSRLERWRLVDANFGGADLERMESSVKCPFKPGINFTDLKENEEFYQAPYSWLAVRSGKGKKVKISIHEHSPSPVAV